MADIPSSNDPTPAAPTAKSPRDNAQQSKTLANAIATAERMIQSVLTTPDLLLALAPLGYNELELHKGLTLFSTAQAKFNARQEALGVATLAMKARDFAFKVAQKEFTAYRAVVQVNYRDADRANLGASGRVPADGDKFRTTARSAYASALQEPYLSVLSGYGFNRERLTTALGVLDKLSAAETTYENAVSKAKVATEVRDVAAEALKSWITKLRTIAKITLADNPALLRLLKD